MLSTGNTLLPTLIMGLLAAAASMGGGLVVQLRPAWARAGALPLAAFAGGAILGAAFLDLLPEAIEKAGPSACDFALVAFFAIYLLETHLVGHGHSHGDAGGPHGHGHDEPPGAVSLPSQAHAAHAHGHDWTATEGYKVALAPRASDVATLAKHSGAIGVSPLAMVAGAAFALHSGFDGFALGVGASLQLGPAATLGVLAHKVPEGLALSALLVAAKVPKRRAFLLAAANALMTPLVAVLAATSLANAVSPVVFGRLLGLVAGSFVYIAAADLLPEVAAHPRLSRTFLMIAGIGVAFALRFLG